MGFANFPSFAIRRPGGACGGWGGGSGRICAGGGGAPAGLAAAAVEFTRGGTALEAGGKAGFAGARGGVLAGGTAAPRPVDMLMTAVSRNKLVFMYLFFWFPDPELDPWTEI
jgi:hypothetical protein